MIFTGRFGQFCACPCVVKPTATTIVANVKNARNLDM
jgi:hypothetical protein